MKRRTHQKIRASSWWRRSAGPRRGTLAGRVGDRRSPAETLFKIICAISLLFAIDSGESQNIVGLTTSQFTANPVRLTDTDVSELFVKAPPLPMQFAPVEARRVAAKLEAHVAEFLDGAPWNPL